MSSEQFISSAERIRSAVAALLSTHAAGTDPAAEARYLACFEQLPVACGYKYVPAEARQIYAGVATRGGHDAARLFLFRCILTALATSLASPKLSRLPVRVKAHQLRQYERIVNDPAPTLRACESENDLFHKDFGLATLRLYAGGSNLIDHNAGLGRSMLWKGGLSSIPRRLLTVAKVGGFRPFFEIHAHKFYMAEFTEEGRNECYCCCAELYLMHPEVLGMIAGSWFYDPVISTISPRLAYLRKVPQAGGAYVWFDSFDAGATRNALATSPTRRAMHLAGNYTPASYTIIWPRARQIAWAKSVSPR